MRMSCGPSDGEPTNPASEVSRRDAFPHQTATAAIYYNRLEYRRSFRLLYAVNRPSDCLPFAAANPASCSVAAAPNRIAASRPFLSLVQGRELCHKRFRGITTFRRGIAE
jgi:hypothetical protein